MYVRNLEITVFSLSFCIKFFILQETLQYHAKMWKFYWSYPANISTLFQRCLLVDVTSRRGTTSNQQWNNVVYFNIEMYNVEQCRINVVYFNVDMNNVRQRRNNIVIFNVKFYNVGKRRNNVVKMTASKKNKKKGGVCLTVLSKLWKFLKDYEKYCIATIARTWFKLFHFIRRVSSSALWLTSFNLKVTGNLYVLNVLENCRVIPK